MKLDPRIKSVSDILTPFDTERAEQFIGQKGYFGIRLVYFSDLKKYCIYGTLAHILANPVQVDPFLKMEGDDQYQFFIPESSLRPAEKKKWRPFTLDEFRAKFPLLSPVPIRAKTNREPKAYCFIGYAASGAIILGSNWFRFNSLFEDYELKDENGNWTPFGVEE